MLWLRASTGAKEKDESWSIAEGTIQDALLVVVSQDCDIFAPSKTEPCVEAITARWSSNRSEIHSARKGNSARLYLLKEEEGGRALIADARRRIHIDKEALRCTKFTAVLRGDHARARFASWVAGRYDRPAIADEVVEHIQKPVVKGIDLLLQTGDTRLHLIDRVDEFRFSVFGSGPLGVDFIALIDDADELSAEEEADLGEWLQDVLVKEGGPVQEVRIAFRGPRTISLHDYEQTTRLPLDHYTPEAAFEAADPERLA